MKKIPLISAVLASAMLLTGCPADVEQPAEMQTTASAATAPPAEKVPETEQEGKMLNIYSNNDVLKNIVSHSYPDYVDNGDDTGYIGDVKIVWMSPPPNADYNYSDVLQYVIENPKSEEKRIDLFVIEPDAYYYEDYANKYALPLSELGITDADTAEMYDYTLQLGTSDGELKGLLWEACPGVFAYRRSIAKEILGTDEPSEVQKYVEDWNKFTETAALMKQGGYYIHISKGETFRLFQQSADAPIKNSDEIYIDPALKKWAEQSKEHFDNGYITACSVWSEEWADRMADGTVFGCFMPSWGVEYTIPSNIEYSDYTSAFGDWAICEGPAPYFWGASALCVSKDTDDKTAAAEFIRTVLCNAEVMENYGLIEYTTYHDTPVSIRLMPNNTEAVKALSENSAHCKEFLGGQNPYSVYDAAARKADASSTSCADYFISLDFESAMYDYIEGKTTYDEAMEKFLSEQ